MKKIVLLVLIYFGFFIPSCCLNDAGSLTYITIHSVQGLLYSFDNNGTFPYYDVINRDELGISIMPDSTTEMLGHIKQNGFINQLYACEDPNSEEYVNKIDSINIFTVYEFDSNYPASSNVNGILRPIGTYGEYIDVDDISSLAFIMNHLKFITSPTHDTLQFEVTGRIIDGPRFRFMTEKLIIN